MKLIALLHFYQPHNQQKDILNRIVHESYLPLTKGLLERPHSRVVVNISGALIQLLVEHGYSALISNFVELHGRGNIEITGSAMYHAFLPLLPEYEIKQQITLNEDLLSATFPGYKRCGFFSPEMAVNQKVLNVVKKRGFDWIAVPQVAYGSSVPDANKLYVDERSGLKIMFRNKRVSSLILSAVTQDSQELLQETKDLQQRDSYWFVVMDAETFGHHRIGHEKMFFDLLDNKNIQACTASDMLVENLPQQKVKIRPSTWTNTEQDFWLDKEQSKYTEARSFILWSDPGNPIHKLQWELTELAISEVEQYPERDSPQWKEARDKLNKAVASDQYWWASAKPWWSLEMIEQGAFALKDVLKSLGSNSKAYKKSDELYRAILDQAFDWQRSGYIRTKHLNNSSTFMKEPLKERTPAEWYNQLMLELEDQMESAAKKRNFEQAIKWRDALIKIRKGTDIYDVLHVIDELWTARNIPELKPFFEYSWDEFSEYIKEYFREAGNKHEFEEWKKRKESTQH